MPKIQLLINGLTHYGVADHREEFLQTAVGLKVVLVAQPCVQDVRCVAAYVGPMRIGNVMGDHALLAQQVLLAAADEMVIGEVTEVLPRGYNLRVDLGERSIVSEEEVMAKLPLGLGEWTTSVATMAPTNEQMGRGQMLKKLMWAYLKIGDIAQVEEVTEALYREMRYDLSGDMQSERKLLCQSLMKSGDERLQQAASRLLEASQRMGGEHQMQEVGTWLQEDLAKSMEADLLVAQTRKVSRQQVVEEAKALPSDLYHHWLTDARTFARVLYGMRLAREDVLRVLSCLIWLQRTEGQEAPAQECSNEADYLVGLSLEMDDKEVQKSLEMLLARADDMTQGAFLQPLMRLRRWNEPEQPEAKELPEALATEEARVLLEKAQKAGFLDEQWQPTQQLWRNGKVSMAKASVLAFIIGGKLNLTPLWDPFEALWNAKDLRVAYSQAMNAQYYSSLYDEIKRKMR